jgi:2-polyprenyl-3-methyl-5-hydroxy-6-metoxy-1,4-benzoquinol methylase
MAILVPKYPPDMPFPTDPRDVQAWDAFWSTLLKSTYDPKYLRQDHTDYQYRNYIGDLIEPHGTRCLVAGNGISVLPEMLSHFGMEVCSVDCSATAVEYCRHHPSLEIERLAFFGSGRPVAETEVSTIRKRMGESHDETGSSDYLVDDLFSCTRGTETLDLIIMQNVIEHFVAEDRVSLAHRLYAWLKPGGIAIVESQNYLGIVAPRRTEQMGIEVSFEAAGFLFHLRESYVWRQEQFRVMDDERLRMQEVAGSGGGWFSPRRSTRELDRRSIERLSLMHEGIQEGFRVRCDALRDSDMQQRRVGRKIVVFRSSR